MANIWDPKKYAACARQAQAEGIVLLKNDNKALPLAKGTKIAVFGRTQMNYFKSGTGSGGAVNVDYITGIWEGLLHADCFELNQAVRKAYEEFVKDHPFDAGHGWATEPWFQEEMIPDEALVQEAAKESEAAVLILGRTAGEDHDNSAAPGSYLLTEDEETLLKMITGAFKRTIVVLNTGNIIDMKWVKEYDPAAVLYAWQGGQEGGDGIVDVLSGKANPSGRLPDTIAYDITDYPSTKNFGDPDRNLWQEDIYVGYRYFETFAKDKVLYPFGFGLSYTSFTQEVTSFDQKDGVICLCVNVANTGDVAGKEVVQVYIEAPQGKLGKPVRSLVAFGKTKLLSPGEKQELSFKVEPYTYASYDDAGATGYQSAYVLEEGTYNVYSGVNVREATLCGSFEIENVWALQQLAESMAPVREMERIVPKRTSEGLAVSYQKIPQRTLDQRIKREEGLDELVAKTRPYTGDKGYKLKDVAEGRVPMEDFLAQISDEDLMAMMRGEGMCSPKVTPGIAGAFGGVTEELVGLGIPVCGCADGPSGIRMDCGTHAFAMPNGTCQASTFNVDLIRELYVWEGLELRKNRIDCLLGPGMNIHRNPLNGRNFEYFSEDPLLTGKMAANQLQGMHQYGTTGVIKHFCCNTQEFRRSFVDAVVSERAVREIYLKGYEIAVKEGEARAVMTSYGPVNGIFSSSNYDLLTRILRGEWGFDGIVMTDWWAKGNDAPEEEGQLSNVSSQVRAQNDLNMVNSNAAENSGHDDLPDALSSGRLTRAELCRSAENICRFAMGGISYLFATGAETELDHELEAALSEEDLALRQTVVARFLTKEYELDTRLIKTERGETTVFNVQPRQQGLYKVTVRVRVKEGFEPQAQLPMSIFIDKAVVKAVTLTGADTDWQEFDFQHVSVVNSFFLKFFFGQTGLEIDKVHFELLVTREELMRRFKEANKEKDE